MGFLGGAQIDRYGQHQHHRRGRLRAPHGASARQRRRGGDRHPRPANCRDQPARPAGLSRAGGLHHQSRAIGCKGARGASWACPAPGPTKVVTDKAILEADPSGRAGALRALSRRRGRRGAGGIGWPLRSRGRLATCAAADRARAAPAARGARSPAAVSSRDDQDDDRRRSPPDRAPATPSCRGCSPSATWCCSTSSPSLSLRWTATAAAAGPSSLTLWVLAGLFFFIPQGLAVSDLSARFPRGGRDLLLDQADLRRGPRIHLRLVLLGQQHPVLPQPADVDRGHRHLRDRTGRDRSDGRLDLHPRRPR